MCSRAFLTKRNNSGHSEISEESEIDVPAKWKKGLVFGEGIEKFARMIESERGDFRGSLERLITGDVSVCKCLGAGILSVWDSGLFQGSSLWAILGM